MVGGNFLLLRAHPGHGLVYFCVKRSGTPLAHQHKHIIAHTTNKHKCQFRDCIIYNSMLN